ncbi:MAG: hypothetical protein V1779_14950 [bacterium]
MVKRYIEYVFCNDDEKPLQSCIDNLLSYFSTRNLSQNNILFLTVFTHTNKENFYKKRSDINQLFNDNQFSIPHIEIAQSCFVSEIAFEVQFIEGDFEVIESNQKFKIIKSADAIELYASAFCEHNYDNFQQSTDKVFEQVNKILSKYKFEINTIVRQWNYIEDILKISETGQHYQIFNDARSVFYNLDKWEAGYPAATGIGVNAGGVSIVFYAFIPISDILIIPLNNPLQKDAHRYSKEVLVGDSMEAKTTPKFERGKLILRDDGFDIFVSGTAAIIGEEANEKSGAGQQTLTTIQNIEKLIELDNVKKNFRGFPEFKKVNISNIRVYIKNQSDFENVKQICEANYPNIPIIYLQADVCRDELLVEIEANCFGLKLQE